MFVYNLDKILKFKDYLILNGLLIEEDLVSQSKELRQKLENSYRKNELVESLNNTRSANERFLTEQQNISSAYVSPTRENQPESGIGIMN